MSSFNASRSGGVASALLVGFLPLIFLVGVSGLTYGALLVARQLDASAPFAVQQQTSILIVVIGLALALIAYLATAWILFRRMTSWRMAGLETRIRVVLWALFITALIVLLPLIIAIVLPQHPAPPI